MSSVSSTAPPSAPTSPRKSPGKLHLRVPLQKLARRVSHFDFHHHRREESEGMPEHRRAASTSHMEPVRSVSVAVAPSLVVSASKGRESSESESSSSGGEDRTSEHGLLSEEEAPKLEPAWSELDFADSAASTLTIPDSVHREENMVVEEEKEEELMASEDCPNTAVLIASAWPAPPQHIVAEDELSFWVEDEIKHAPEVIVADEQAPEVLPQAAATDAAEILLPPSPIAETDASDPFLNEQPPQPPALTDAMEAKTPSPSPGLPIVEPEVPDPFLVDDPEEPAEETEETAPAATDVPLSEAAPAVDTNKDVPPPPPSESDQDEEDAPDLYLPELVLATMFLPIPNADPLTTLLNKYIYPPDKRPARDLTGDWHKADFHALVMSNSWRALARMARDRLVAADPEDLTLVLGLWYLRLSALARLRLFNQTAAECSNLFNVLDAIDPPSARAWLMDRILPFELEVMRARLRYWGGDPAGYIDALAGLLAKCKVKARATPKRDEATIGMWKERGARVALILASQMAETKDYTAATRLLEPLAVSPPLRSAVGRIYLQAGDVHAAERHFAAVAADPGADTAQKETNTAVLAAARGEWAEASEVLRGLLDREQDNHVAVNNLAVALLAQGKLKDGIAILEKSLQAAPATIAVAEPFLFNLSTLYELRSASAVNNKRDLLITVARYSGDGLRTTCLKMPTS